MIEFLRNVHFTADLCSPCIPGFDESTKFSLTVQRTGWDDVTASVDWTDCVLAALAWGWTDGHKKSLDSISYVQRLTPRRPRSNWSKKNCALAERLIEEGRMQPAGRAQVEAARNDGRWERAYAGISNMEMPSDFVNELEKHPVAKEFYGALDRTNLFSIYYRVLTAKRPETRASRIAEILTKLERRERYH